MAQAKFCPNCGAPLPAHGEAPARGSVQPMLPWLGFAAILLVAFGYLAGSRATPASGANAAGPSFAEGGAIIAAPDISSLSPEERVDRLFNRVMALASAGQDDSVAFFAPMAINALAALMPLDAHRRYDLGLIHLAAGDPAAARAQADTILAAAPTHLLGLALGMRAATAERRTVDARRLGARLTAAASSERAKGLREYADHAPDITESLEEVAGRRTSRIAQPR